MSQHRPDIIQQRCFSFLLTTKEIVCPKKIHIVRPAQYARCPAQFHVPHNVVMTTQTVQRCGAFKVKPTAWAASICTCVSSVWTRWHCPFALPGVATGAMIRLVCCAITATPTKVHRVLCTACAATALPKKMPTPVRSSLNTRVFMLSWTLATNLTIVFVWAML